MKINKITSKENKILKNVIKLKDSKKFREATGVFIAEGLRLCTEALNCKVRVLTAFFTENEYKKNERLALSLNKETSVYILPENLFKKISETVKPQGILFVCNRLNTNFITLNDLCKNKSGEHNKILILENIQDPSNLGTVLRSAETLGVNNIILTDDCCSVYNPKVVRGSMGSIFRLFFHITKNLPKTASEIKGKFKIPVYAAALYKNSLPITQIKFPKICAVIIGNEGSGITKETLDSCTNKIKIPISKDANSLNASSAASIMLWELVRERYIVNN